MLINVHSAYSLRYGTIPIKRLVNLLIEEGHDTAVLTDINNTSGTLDFIQECQAKNFNGLAGIEFRNGDELLFIGIAKNNAGFRELNEFLSEYNQSGAEKPKIAPAWSNVLVIYPLGARNERQLREFEYIGVKVRQLTKLYAQTKSFLDRVVMWQPITFAAESDFELHRQLRAVDHNLLLSQLSEAQTAGPKEAIYSADQLISAYKAYPGIIFNTQKLLAQCRFEFDFSTSKNKKIYTANGSVYDDKLLLEKLVMKGCEERYGRNHTEAISRVRKELEIIDRLGFSAYYLIAWDTVRYSMSQNYLHVGRGSGANSIAAYCLQITNVCPIELDLYFERFLNPKRKSPPDFDIDFSWRDRDDVIDYLFKRWGSKHTARLGAMSTFGDRSIIRELGKVHGLPKSEIDQMVHYPQEASNKNSIAQKILHTVSLLDSFPNLRSIHAGGILISEEPISQYCAVDLPPTGFLTTQFDMHTAEAIGQDKIDILSQAGLGSIREAVDIIRYNRNEVVDISRTNEIKTDPKVNAQASKGETVGCFYTESPASRAVLKKLRCDNYLTMVAASSIIRPGVGTSGMMKAYIHRYRNPNDFEYLHPILEEQLKETFGVMIYQEDVLKIGHHYGGLDLAKSDVLRRLMSGKTRGQKELLGQISADFFGYAARNGRKVEVTAEIWRQMESFAGYSFSKAHSASFALESYQAIMLKTYYPLEFMTAVVNNEGGFYRTWLYLVEASRYGGQIQLPCINKSEAQAKIYGKEIYIGLSQIKALEVAVIARIIRIRQSGGIYQSLEDLVERTELSLKQLIILIRSGALTFTGKSKKQLLWLANLVMAKRDAGPKQQSGSTRLFQPVAKEISIPCFPVHRDEDYFDEIEFLEFPVSSTPFDMLKTEYQGPLATDLCQAVGQELRILGRYVTHKRLTTRKGEPMAFGTFLDRGNNFFDTVNFPNTMKEFPFAGEGVYLILGEVTVEFDYPAITVKKMAKLPIRPDPRFS